MTKLNQAEATLGIIEIAPDVLETITGIAVAKMPEVHSLQGTLVTGMNRLLGKPVYTKGVHFRIGEQNERIIDIIVALHAGVSIAKVAKMIQTRVKEQILFMCDITIDEVNVFVSQIVFEKETGEINE